MEIVVSGTEILFVSTKKYWANNEIEVGFSSQSIREPVLLVRVRERDKGFMMLMTTLKAMLLFSSFATAVRQDLGTRMVEVNTTLGRYGVLPMRNLVRRRFWSRIRSNSK